MRFKTTLAGTIPRAAFWKCPIPFEKLRIQISALRSGHALPGLIEYYISPGYSDVWYRNGRVTGGGREKLYSYSFAPAETPRRLYMYSPSIHGHAELRNERNFPRGERETEGDRKGEPAILSFSREAEFLADGVSATVCRAGNARSEQPRSAEEIFRSRRPRRIK